MPSSMIETLRSPLATPSCPLKDDSSRRCNYGSADIGSAHDDVNHDKTDRSHRPSISHLPTSERLRIGAQQHTSTRVQLHRATGHGRRLSRFKEIGLEDEFASTQTGATESSPQGDHDDKFNSSLTQSSYTSLGKTNSKDSHDDSADENEHGLEKRSSSDPPPQPLTWYRRFTRSRRPTWKTSATAAPASTFTNFPTVAIAVCLIAVMSPLLGPNSGIESVPSMGVDAGVIRTVVPPVETLPTIAERADSPIDICARWSHQTAILNGTLYIYGGQATTTSGQSTDTWNNDFLTLDLTKSWSTSSPSISGLPQPSGPPAIANGYLWTSYSSLWLYGGEFADNPYVEPAAVSTWEYDVSSATWIEHSSPQTSAGKNSDGGGIAVQRVAEGMGQSVPELGLSFYFSGHEDLSTTPGWSNQIAREYLNSLLEFTHPSYTNDGVTSLAAGDGAGSDGVYRNITSSSLQQSGSLGPRADGALVYIPGWGADGMLLTFAGGTADDFASMTTIDIYDIATSSWYQQSTSGDVPQERVDPCAVVAAAPDGSSFNIYMYGGQNLQPAGNQTQLSDMWILTVPSFTWIEVDLSSQDNPAARAGHTCNIWDSQMIVIGGYMGSYDDCDSPGIHIFNASSLQWETSYTALSGDASLSEVSNDVSGTGFTGSNGYTVPDVVVSVVGGASTGGATATTPAVGPASSGPIATGKPPTWTVTVSGAGSTVTATAPGHTSTATTTSSPSSETGSSDPGNSGSSKDIPAIVTGVVAGVLLLVALYLGFCTWLYRRQLALYKNHVTMAQRAGLSYGAVAPEDGMAGAAVGAATNGRRRSSSYSSFRNSTGLNGGSNGNGMVGLFFDNGNGNGNGSINGNGRRSSESLRDSRIGAFGTNISGVGQSPSSATRPESAHYYRNSMAYMGAGGGIHDIEEEAEGDTATLGHSTMQGYEKAANRSDGGSVEDLLSDHEPSFISVVMSPRRTLRVINRD